MSYAKMEVAFPRHFLTRVYTEILGRKPTPKDKINAGALRTKYFVQGNRACVKIYMTSENRPGKLNVKSSGAMYDHTLHWQPIETETALDVGIIQIGFHRKNDKDWRTGAVYPLKLIKVDRIEGAVVCEIMAMANYTEAMDHMCIITSRKNNVATYVQVNKFPKKLTKWVGQCLVDIAEIQYVTLPGMSADKVAATPSWASGREDCTGDPDSHPAAGPNTAEVPRVQAHIGVLANLLKDHAKAVASIDVVDPEFRDVILQGLDRALASKMTAALNAYCVEYKKPHKK